MQLPVSAQSLVPHGPPIRMVDTLVEASTDQGRVQTLIRDNCLAMDAQGVVDDAMVIELMAQACAAVRGYLDTLDGHPIQKGFLVAIPRLWIKQSLRLGDQIDIRVKTQALMGGFVAAECDIIRDQIPIAGGSFRFRLLNS